MNQISAPNAGEVDLASLPMAQQNYRRTSDLPVERGTILLECAAVRNGSPLYWDEDTACAVAGGVVAPPSMLSTWGRPHSWQPGDDDLPQPMQIHFDLKEHFDLPAAVVASYVITLHDPVLVGDVLTTDQRLVSVSPVKTTRKGAGRFWSFDVDYRNQHGDLVGVESWTMFSYRPAAEDRDAATLHEEKS